MPIEHFDIVIVGAGLSGVGAAYRIQTQCPKKRYVILEGRDTIGGTWDLFRYPGVRSDSDMFTLGYPFRPWTEAKAIADGPSILKYIRDTADENHITGNIRFHHRVRAAEWSSANSHWRLEVEAGEERKVAFTCNFLYVCSGYYNYENGHMPAFAGIERFKGTVVHPQHWPQDLRYDGRRVVVIGSGATAVTLVPAIAERAAHVTMLQRSPTYIASLPSRDAIADALRRALPEKLAHSMARWKNILFGLGFYQFCRRMPGAARRMMRRGAERLLPAGYDVDTHFNPKYQPWDQRLCLVPNADLFEAIKGGRASIVTDQIETFTEDGLRLKSGRQLEADIVVTATGLKIMLAGGMRVVVDGEPVNPASLLVYKGLMLSGIPNFALCVGYTNASWTLRADLSSVFVCRLLQYMDRHGYQQCVPAPPGGAMQSRPLLGLNSGYILRAADELPKQGSKRPWLMRQNYILDAITMRLGKVADEGLRFTRATGRASVVEAEPQAVSAPGARA
jgi:monooxygenase